MADHKIYKSIICGLLFVVGFLLIYESPSSLKAYRSDIDNMSGGDYVRFIYIGSSGCSFSNHETMHQMVDLIKNRFREASHANDFKTITTGIAQDLNAGYGIDFLKKTGPYDEIYSGASWYNIGINKYIWETFEGPAATPQIIVSVSQFDVGSAGDQIGKISQKEKLLKRYVGFTEIEKLYLQISSPNENDSSSDLFGLDLIEAL